MSKVILVGSENAGKSTLFNRLLGQHRSIVTDIPGTTRDMLHEVINLTPQLSVNLIDTPGLSPESDVDSLRSFIQDSDCILFVVDGKEQRSPLQDALKKLIFDLGKQSSTILVVNKGDQQIYHAYELFISEFYAYGFSELVGVSGLHGYGLDDLRHCILKKLPRNVASEFQDERIPVAFVGKPNTGKSTLINTFLQQPLSRVGDQPGTTLDYLKADFSFGKEKYTLYDTAGMRRKVKMHGLEKIAVDKTMSMVTYIRPVLIYLIDIVEGVTHRDMTLISQLWGQGLPIVIGINKIDLIGEKELQSKKRSLEDFFKDFLGLPLLFFSAQTGEGIHALFRVVQNLRKQMRLEVSTSQLNKIVSGAFLTNTPRFAKNKVCKIYYLTQKSTNPQIFLTFVNDVSRVNQMFKRWLENTLKKHLPLKHVPLLFEFKSSHERKEE